MDLIQISTAINNSGMEEESKQFIRQLVFQGFVSGLEEGLAMNNNNNCERRSEYNNEKSSSFEKMIKTTGKGATSIKSNKFTENICPECGSMLFHEEGCILCHSCGYSRCG